MSYGTAITARTRGYCVGARPSQFDQKRLNGWFLDTVIGRRHRPRWGAMALPARAHANLDSRADSQRVPFDRIQGRSRMAATLQARHRALGGPHPHGDLLRRHARGGSSGNEICHQDSEYAVPEQGALSLAVVTRMRQHREPAGQYC
jgi:hypothetical protein